MTQHNDAPVWMVRRPGSMIWTPMDPSGVPAFVDAGYDALPAIEPHVLKELIDAVEDGRRAWKHGADPDREAADVHLDAAIARASIYLEGVAQVAHRPLNDQSPRRLGMERGDGGAGP